ncbi:helix-turn-helix transcriptional regulator [Paucibacter sp. DJ1R-11]|uniref:helix-turn-helix transcriptional regulator n=1 Tax=Paucibacter sp. DJ1R-11 TaxID=2893556 RepID=UPI00398C4D76
MLAADAPAAEAGSIREASSARSARIQFAIAGRPCIVLIRRCRRCVSEQYWIYGLTPALLARAFRSHFRCSHGEFSRQHRPQRAAKLLAHSRLNLSAVTQDCGFFDQPHLSRSFQGRFGMTPRKYRVRAG